VSQPENGAGRSSPAGTLIRFLAKGQAVFDLSIREKLLLAAALIAAVALGVFVC
jgi:hypothetical protein